VKLGLLGKIVRRVKARIRKQPESQGQRVLVTEQTIDSVLARQSGDADELEEFLDSVIQDRIQDIEGLNETLRGKN